MITPEGVPHMSMPEIFSTPSTIEKKRSYALPIMLGFLFLLSLTAIGLNIFSRISAERNAPDIHKDSAKKIAKLETRLQSLQKALPTSQQQEAQQSQQL